VAVQVRRAGRRLVWISADGGTVDPLAEGDYYRPAYSPRRGLLALISADGQGGPADAGQLCLLDPQNAATPACSPALADGRRLGRPAWSPNGRSLLVLAAGPGGDYTQLLAFAAQGDDAAQWHAPASGYRSADIRSAAWVADDRVAVLLADRPDAPAHVRLLARRANGSFRQVEDFPALTGSGLAAAGHYLALRRGQDATKDGPMVLLDLKRAHPRVRSLTTGVNPAWAG
jgi:hypothetical protein